MSDIPGWLEAGGTVVLAAGTVIGAARYMVVGPLTRRTDEIEKTATARHLEIKERLTEQDAAIGKLQTMVDTKLGNLDTMFREHEKDDGERFDEAGEKLESHVSGLRRDVAQAHDNQVTHQRNDIGALGQRIDQLVGKVIETLAVLAGRKGSTSGAD